MGPVSRFESEEVFSPLEAKEIINVIPWRRLKGRENPSDVFSVKDRIYGEGPEYLRAIYKNLRVTVESLNGGLSHGWILASSPGRVLGTLVFTPVWSSVWFMLR